MPAAARSPLVLGTDGLAQNQQASDVQLLGAMPVASLPTLASTQRALAYATNGRAVVGGALAVLYFQAANAGTGCLVTWSGSAWQVAGTASTVQA